MNQARKKAFTEKCFEEWFDQFQDLEAWHGEEMEGHEYILWEAFQAGWDALDNKVHQMMINMKQEIKNMKG